MRVLLENLPAFIVAGCALGTGNLIITKTKIFEKMRLWILSKSSFFGELIKCPICFGTWLAVPGTVITGSIIQTTLILPNLFLSWLFLDFLILVATGIIFNLYKDR